MIVEIDNSEKRDIAPCSGVNMNLSSVIEQIEILLKKGWYKILLDHL